MLGFVLCILLLIILATVPLLAVLHMSYNYMDKLIDKGIKPSKKSLKQAQKDVQDMQAKSVDDALKGFTEAQIREWMFNHYLNNNGRSQNDKI